MLAALVQRPQLWLKATDAMLPLLSLALVSAPSAAQALPGHRKQPANLQLTLLAAAVLPRALSIPTVPPGQSQLQSSSPDYLHTNLSTLQLTLVAAAPRHT